MQVKKAKALAETLMTEHGLLGWTLKLDTAKCRLGVCRYFKKQIGLSKAYIELNDEEVIKNTILHEIAHALVGPGHGHDRVWKRQAKAIGCNGDTCAGNEAISPKGKWVATCGTCEITVHRHRITPRNRSKACSACCNKHNAGRYDEKYKLVFKQN